MTDYVYATSKSKRRTHLFLAELPKFIPPGLDWSLCGSVQRYACDIGAETLSGVDADCATCKRKIPTTGGTP